MEYLFATVKMPISLYKSLKNDHEEMILKNVKDESIDYTKDKLWKEAKQMLIEAVRNLDEIEQDIRLKSIENKP